VFSISHSDKHVEQCVFIYTYKLCSKLYNSLNLQCNIVKYSNIFEKCKNIL